MYGRRIATSFRHPKQGGRTGQILAYKEIAYFGHFLKITEVGEMLATFFTENDDFDEKYGFGNVLG
jgi:hypothetical protein